jgi:hypothetical protein
MPPGKLPEINITSSARVIKRAETKNPLIISGVCEVP